MDLKKIEKLLELMRQYNLHELGMSQGDEKIRLKTPEAPSMIAPQNPMLHPMAMMQAGMAMPQQSPMSTASAQPSAPAAATAGDVPKGNQKYIRSPFVGTFYRAPSPGAEPFVSVGQRVRKGDVLCIIEAMKLMNEIEAETEGTIVKVLADNEHPVEFDQPLFIIE